MLKNYLNHIILSLILFCASCGWADDVGITKARLIQKSEKSYVLEADVTQVLVWAIKAPIFPDRFQVSELEYVNQAGWIVVQATATTSGEPLSPQDEILLPWMRNGAAITVQWLDDSVHQGLFLRSLEGIRVPLRLLKPHTPSLGEVCVEHFTAGLEHLSFKWIHLLFVCAFVLVLPAPDLFKYLLYYTFGQGFSLILAEIGLPGLDLLFADILGVILILMFAHATVRELSLNRYLPLLFIFGLLHGLAYNRELANLNIGMEQKLPALFMFNTAIDIGQFVAVGLFLLVVIIPGKLPYWKRILGYTTGALSVAILFVLFQEHVMAGKTNVLNFSSTQIATQYTLPTSQNTQGGGRQQRGARRLTNPIMSYLSVEPFEVRQEILIQARAVVQFLGVNEKGMGSIPVESLDLVKNGILDVVKKANPISIDGKPVEPVMARADFVTLGPAGVVLRDNPVQESLDNGIIGLTLVYETPNLADEVILNWRLFSKTVKKIEATTTDPFGGATMILSPNDNVLRWKSRLTGYRVSMIEEVAIEKKALPVISLLLFLMVIGLFIVSVRQKKSLLGRPVLLSVVGLGLVLYPFYRSPLDLPFLSQWTPSIERTSTILDDLLTNVYRAFDVRDENRVYDRLAMSVMGDQLAQIYLQNRQSLELENRGGARANVDKVDILAIDSVKRSEKNGFIADAVWTVSGSVSHYGHTHYRRNQNHALVTFVMGGNFWKIRDIELIDEKRLL